MIKKMSIFVVFFMLAFSLQSCANQCCSKTEAKACSSSCSKNCCAKQDVKACSADCQKDCCKNKEAK